MNLFDVPKNTYYNVGSCVWFYSETMGEVREYVVTKVYTHYRNERQVAYKLAVRNQNNRFWAVVLEKNLIKEKHSD